jgi:hypothetical protein
LLRFGVQFRFRVWVYRITILGSSSCSHDQWPSSIYSDWRPWRDQPQAYINGCATRRAVALKRPIFKLKKGFTTISLGLIYHSKALPQPPSRDTIPLKNKIATQGYMEKQESSLRRLRLQLKISGSVFDFLSSQVQAKESPTLYKTIKTVCTCTGKKGSFCKHSELSKSRHRHGHRIL